MPRAKGQVWCTGCWCEIPKGAPRIVINNRYLCASCVYDAEKPQSATNVGVCSGG